MPNRPPAHSYRIKVEVGLIVALALLIAAFRSPVQRSTPDSYDASEQPAIQIEDIPITATVERPPPPPKPAQPVEVPDVQEIEEYPIDLQPDVFVTLDPGTPPTRPFETTPEEKVEPIDVFVIVEEEPEMLPTMPEAMRSLQASITYPEIAKRAGVEGRVIVQFVVDEQGKVVDPFVVRGIGAGCDEEAVKAVRTLKFKPGKQRGRAVKVQMTLPVTFRLR